MLRKTVAAVAALGISAVLVLAAAAPASAMEVRPPAPPGATQRWGQPVSSLPVTPHVSLTPPIVAVPPPDRGGWINEPFYHQTGAPAVNGVPPAVTSPVIWRLGDLTRYTPPTGTGSSFGLYVYGFSKKDNRTNPTPSRGQFSVTSGAIPASKLPAGELRCSSSEWLDGNAIVSKGFTGGGGTMNTGIDEWGQSYFTLASTTGCQNIVSIAFNVCYFIKGQVDQRCEQVLWLAEDNYGAGPDENGNYQSVPYSGAGKDWDKKMCQLDMGSSPDCVFILQDRVDGTDFAAVCANAPTPQWLDFGWLGEWTGHMARCLFAPANGFDREEWVSTAWSGGPGGAISGIAVKTGQAFNIGETCGQLFSGNPAGAFPVVTVNTCSWNAWGGPLKIVLGIWATVAFGMWAIGFLINCIAGVVNRRVPNPTAEAAE